MTKQNTSLYQTQLCRYLGSCTDCIGGMNVSTRKQMQLVLSPAKLYCKNCRYCMSNNLRGTATLVWMTRALITRSLCDHATELLMFLLNRCSFNVKKHFYHFIFRYKVPPAQITMKLEPLDKRSRTVPVMKKQNSWEKLKHAAVQIM